MASSTIDSRVLSMIALSIFFSMSVRQASMIMAEAITMTQTQKKNKKEHSINHWVLHLLLIVILALELFFSDSQALRC